MTQVLSLWKGWIEGGASPLTDAEFMMTISASVCLRHDLTMGQLYGSDKARKFSRARQEAYYLMRLEKTDRGFFRFSFPAIGKHFQRDHTTILHGVKEHAARIAQDAPLRPRKDRKPRPVKVEDLISKRWRQLVNERGWAA